MNPWRWVDPRVGKVRVADLRAYFLGKGWQLKPSPNPSLLHFERPAEDHSAPLIQVAPAAEQSADFTQGVMELITTLSELADRHPVGVLEDMLSAKASGGSSTTGAHRA